MGITMNEKIILCIYIYVNNSYAFTPLKCINFKSNATTRNAVNKLQ